MKIPPMPPLKKFYTTVPIAQNGQAKCIIAVPNGDEYAQMGSKLAEAIKKISSAEVPVKPADQLPIQALEESNMILLGYFANNPLINRLYDLHYTPLDAARPGPGAHEIRTVHDPLGKGTCFILLSGADAPSVSKAVTDFIASLPQQGDLVIPFTIKVVMPDGKPAYKQDPQAVASRVKSAQGKNFRTVASIVSGAAANFYLTGNPDDLEVFRQTWPLLRDIVKKMPKVGDARGAYYLFNMWDVIEEAPQFSEKERTEITQFLWEFANKFAYANQTEQDKPVPVGNDWDSRVAWDIARYFMKYYNVDVAGLWTWANTRFRSKAKFWRSLEDCPGYGGMTIYDTFYYALSAPYEKFFADGTARRACDYGIAVMNNLGGHAGFGDTSSMGEIGYWACLFLAAAWKYKDGRYLYAYERTHGSRDDFCYNVYRQNEIKPIPPQDLLGIHVVPLPDWVYEHRNKVLGTAPSQMNPVLDACPTPPRQECFDKITFRTGFEPQDQYLILGGISHGYHSHPDGNSIIEFIHRGRYCLFDSGYFVPDTIEHNTLVVYRDGLFEPIPRLTGLAALADFPDLGMTQTYLKGYNGVTWLRNIIWAKGKYFFVIDEIIAEKAGNYGLNAVFRTLSDEKLAVGPDRISALHKGVPFNLISASHAHFKITTTTPHAANRYALLECKAAQMQPGDRQYFMNLFYTASEEGSWPYEIESVGDGIAMLTYPDGRAFVGVGKKEVAQVIVDAAVFYVTENAFSLAGGRSLKVGAHTWFSCDQPINLHLAIGPIATGIIETKNETCVTLGAKGEILLDGKSCASPITVTPGKHQIAFTPIATKLDIGEAKGIVAALTTVEHGGRPMQAAWKAENAKTEKRTVYLNEQGKECRNLTALGIPKCWTEAQRGAGPGAAVDGNPDTYCAVNSSAPWSNALPKDIGMEWANPTQVGCFQIDYYDKNYAPALDGHQLQFWDGAGWRPVEAQVSVDPTGAKWTYTFTPFKTTRLRVLITKFNPSRTAVREMRIFPEKVTPTERGIRIPLPTKGLVAMDLDGDTRAEILATVGNSVKCIRGDGSFMWERDLGAPALCVDAFDLDADGKGEVIVGGGDHKLYCFDYQGNPRWSVLTPADPYFPEIEPATGPVRVVKCADINADGKGEIVIGSGNWFAYAYDHTGKKLWGALNWAHQPTSIAFVPLGGGMLGALIGTTYCDANLFAPDGKKITNVSVGYHGAAMCVAAADMEGKGTVKLFAGSRIGGVHCKDLGSDKTWAKFMGAEVTQLVTAEINEDGKRELVAGSRNFYLLVTDSDGNILWCRNVEEAIRDLVVADVNADGKPEIIVATEGGMVRMVDGQGNILGTFKAGDNVTKIIAADLNGDGKLEIVAGADDGFIYGDIK